MIKYYMYKYLSLRTFRALSVMFSLLFLSGCELDGDTSGENENYNYQAACWQAAIVHYVMSIADKLFGDGKKIAIGERAGEAGAAIICISFSIWMALKLLKVLPSFKEHNLGEIWTEIIHKLFLCSFCALILAKTEYFNEAMNNFVFPLYNTIVELGSEMLNTGVNSGSTMNGGEYGETTFETAGGGCVTSASINAEKITDGILPMAKCMVCAIKDRLNIGIKIGIALICSGGIGAILTGVTVLLLFSAAKLFFVLFLIDGLFRLNFAVFLLPIFVMGIPFSYTRKWSKHSFLMFINSSGVMLFLGLLISVSISALQSIVSNMSSVAGGDFSSEHVAGRGPVLLSILLIATLLINIPGIAVGLADKFIGGGGGLEFQKQVSKFVFTVARRVGAAVASYFTAGVANQVNEGLEQYEKIRNIKDKIKTTKAAFSDKLNSLAGYNDD